MLSVDAMTADQRNGIALAAGAAALVGGSVAASSLLTGYPVLGGQAARYAIAAALLASWARLRRRPLPRVTCVDALWLSSLAAFGLVGCSVAQIEATRLNDPAVVGVVIGAAPVVIAVMAPAVTRQRPSRRVLLAAFIVVAGSSATQIGGGGRASSLAGTVATISALIGVAATSLLARPVLPRLGALAVSAYACVIAAAQLILLAVGLHLIHGTPVLVVPTATQAAALVYLTVVVTAIVFLAWYSAVEKLGVERAGLFSGVIPVATLAAVSAAGTGTVSSLQVGGAAAVAAGILVGLTRSRPVRRDRARYIGAVSRAVARRMAQTPLALSPILGIPVRRRGCQPGSKRVGFVGGDASADRRDQGADSAADTEPGEGPGGSIQPLPARLTAGAGDETVVGEAGPRCPM